MGYSTQFSAPEMISTARDTGYVKIKTSSKLVDLVISGSFRGLQHTVFFAPETISADCDPGYMLIGKLSKPVDLVISSRFHGL